MNHRDAMTLRVISPENIILEIKGLKKVNIPLVDDAPIGVRPGHHPLIAETSKGTVEYEDESHHYTIDLHPGVLEIREDLLTILTAGKVADVSEELAPHTADSYDRLMKTLIANLDPDPKTLDEDDE